MLSSLLFIFTEGLRNYPLAYFLMSVGALIVFSPFVVNSVIQNRTQQEKNEMFLEFSRALVESVRSGTPINRSILNMNPEKFGSLGVHIEKLANQIRLGIPLSRAFETFAYDTKSKLIIRAVTLIREADKTGGNINTILDAVAKSVSKTEKIREERKSAVSSIVVEGYIVFVIFIIIMIIVEIQILPMTSGMIDISSEGVVPGVGSVGGSTTDFSDSSIAFISLLITQGFFAGFVIGKLSEENFKAGFKHSFILVALAILISTGSKLIF